jgi:hypothetical protein
MFPYSLREVRPRKLDVEYLGEITENQKADFLGRAYAIIFPIDWPEPFGRSMIESMACGTPVIALWLGSRGDHCWRERLDRERYVRSSGCGATSIDEPAAGNSKLDLRRQGWPWTTLSYMRNY